MKKNIFFFFHDVRLINKQLFSGCKHTCPQKKQELYGKAARKKVESQFSQKLIAKRSIEFYKKIIESC